MNALSYTGPGWRTATGPIDEMPFVNWTVRVILNWTTQLK
jgi:hypothetical protein